MKLEYALFMAEAEGLLDTHESKVQRMLKDLCHFRGKVFNSNIWQFISIDYLSQFGLCPEDLNTYDKQRMASVLETGRI
jgi:hypothetical protein